jgi:hypothetical protein
LGAIAEVTRTLGCEASLVSLSHTREADGERRRCQSPGVSCVQQILDSGTMMAARSDQMVAQ